MTTADPVVREALEILSPPRMVVADWPDVLSRARENGSAKPVLAFPRRHRARRPRRTLVAVALLAAVVIILFATPAFGLRAKIVSLFASGPEAPQRVEIDFAELDRDAPAGMATGVITAGGREVLRAPISEGTAELVLYVAPTRDGGFCSVGMIEPGNGGRITGGTGLYCRTRADLGERAIAVSVSIPGPISADGVIEGPVLVDGSVSHPDIATLELAFEDGTSEQVPLTWVSQPIDAAFFALPVPAAKRMPGHRPIAFIGRNADGEEIAREGASLRAGFPVTTP